MMPPHAVDEIAFGTSLAAVNKGSSIRVYEVDVYGGVRETQYEDKWTGGKSSNVLAKGRIGTPLAATSLGLDHIRVYYVSNDLTAHEICWDGKNWYEGAFGKAGFKVAGYSGGLSAVYLGGRNDVLRVYGQNEDGHVQEFTYDGGKGWQKGSNLGAALPGTAIAATTWGSSPYHIRVYFQDKDRNVLEKTWDGSSWGTGGLRIDDLPPRAALGVTSWGDGSNLSIRLYYGASCCLIKEKAWDGEWRDGEFKEESLPGSKVAAIPKPVLRVYIQTGSHVTAACEFMWEKGWSIGNRALPPA
ncbi:hypothetical protein XA68_12348 [Ophiocordyceps unilateralis]|uniref:Uncharacterized protein n=1 Tax=Ophiocordyceps unilateralis TaxID=268505 RepID=A0A2A9PR18_OPHUN|nr:hypothetical protein XA68_12348 [Ophiocordyceps unilateralis]